VALVLEVLVNGERFTVAGEESLSMLSAHVIARGKLGSDSQGVRSHPMDKPADICLSVSGMTSRGDRERDQHLYWGPRLALRLGDEVRITVRDEDNYESASRRTPVQSYSSSSLSLRKRYLDARSLYFRLRRRYGTRAEKKEKQWRRRIVSEPR
jgi:hypothetical protein